MTLRDRFQEIDAARQQMIQALDEKFPAMEDEGADSLGEHLPPEPDVAQDGTSDPATSTLSPLKASIDDANEQQKACANRAHKQQRVHKARPRFLGPGPDRI